MKLAWQRLEGRNAHEVGRQLLSALYLQETGCDLPEIATTPQGKPFFPHSHLHFSISHTKNHVFCCLCRQNVGIDAEEIGRPMDLRLASRWLSPGELAGFDSSEDTLLRLFVLKESYAKFTGRGWGNYLADTDFSPHAPQLQIIDGCYVAIFTNDQKENLSCSLIPTPI